jgi:hypothetical protein
MADNHPTFGLFAANPQIPEKGPQEKKPFFCQKYYPDLQAMGDCVNCGHDRESHDL